MATCAHNNCRCDASGDSSVTRGDKEYCSNECADGVGCNHPDCACRNPAQGKQRDKGPADDATRSTASNPAHPHTPTKPAENPGHQTTHNPAQGGPSTRRNPEAGKRR